MKDSLIKKLERGIKLFLMIKLSENIFSEREIWHDVKVFFGDHTKVLKSIHYINFANLADVIEVIERV